MRWRVLLAVGVAAGGVLWAARRRTTQASADADLWAEATDPVSPS